MSLFNLFRSDAAVSQISNRDDLLARYKRVRQVSLKINTKLVESLSRDVLYEGGRKLGILKGKTLCFETQDQSSVLMDYCIYDVRRNGSNAVEQYLISFPPDAESAELNYLQTMQRAVYSLFIVETVERGLGVTVRDLRTNETHLVVDIGFAGSAVPGLIIASRLIFLDDFAMTGGAALPVGVPPPAQREELTRLLLSVAAPAKDGSFDPARLIRCCLEQGSSSNIMYEEPGQRSGRERLQPPSSSRPRKIGRNEPCPCGSGRKYKHCCLNRF